MILVLLLTCLCVPARFWDPGRMVVWHDEVFSVIRVLGFSHLEVHDTLYSAGRLLKPADLQHYQKSDPSRTWQDTWQALRGHPEHSPLYYLLARPGSGLTEPAVVGLRLTSIILSLLLLPAVAWLAREVFGAGPAPWIAIALVEVAPIHLLYAQEARQYALWSALIAAGSAAFLRALRRQTFRDWSLYAVLLAIGLYTHLLTVVVAGIHALYGLWHEYGDRPALGRFVVRYAAAAGAALLLFLPWLLVLLNRMEDFQNYTGWMDRPASLGQLVTAWATHVARPFVDLPGLPRAWLVVIPLLAIAVRYTGRHPDRRLLWLLALLPLAMVALPDLILGGRRSLESRYLMPTFLALELLYAGALAQAWSSGGRRRGLAVAGLVLAITGGLASQARILAADTWWNKSYSGQNAAFARLVNGTPHPLILGGDGDVNLGELLSLSYWLRPEVRLLLQGTDGPVRIPPGHTALFALLPGQRLRRQLELDYDVRPFPDTWQWFTLVPRSAPDAAREEGEGASGRGGVSRGPRRPAGS